MVGPHGRGTHPDPSGVQGACPGLGILRQGRPGLPGSRDPPPRRPRPASPTAPWERAHVQGGRPRGLPGSGDPPSREASTSQPVGALGESPLSRAVQGPGISPPGGGGLFEKNFQVLERGLSSLELSFAKVRGKVLAPARVVPQKAFSPIGQVLGPLRELPFCLRGAWDFGDLRPDLSLASEPAWQVRWLVRLCRPRARLGGSAPATGTSATGQATDSVGSFASVGLGRGSGIRPRDGDLRDGPGYGPPELISASEAGNPLGM